jgi:hypothetical protein
MHLKRRKNISKNQFHLLGERFKYISTEKVIPVAVVEKDILAIQTPGDDMMNRTWDIESSVSRHAIMTATRQISDALARRCWRKVSSQKQN